LDFLLANAGRETRYVKGKVSKEVAPDPADANPPLDNPFIQPDIIKLKGDK
jgi:hypothetical protein